MSERVILLFFPRVNTDNTRFMPISVLHLERMIRHKGFKIIVIDEQTANNYETVIEEYAPHIFMGALTAATGYQLKGAIEFSQKIKKHAPQAHTVWTGWHTSLLPELTLNENYVDFVISGQAEEPFAHLLDALLNNSSLNTIAGLGYKENSLLKCNPQGVFKDINTFPEVDYSLINPEAYIFENSFSKRCITYFASHGCPFKCTFCSLATVFNGKWYHKNTAQIIKDLHYLKQKARLDAVSFWDDNFFTHKSFSLELANALIEELPGLKWECCTHAGLFNTLFNDDDLKLFYRAGLRQIFTGAESGDDEALLMAEKKIQAKDNLLFAEKLKKHNINPVFLIIVGFPVNPDKDMQATLDMIRRAKLINKKLKIRLHLFVPVPKTKMFDIALQKGLVMPKELNSYVYFLYQFKAPWLTHDYRWQLELFVNFYLPLVNPFLFKEAPNINLKILTALLSFFFFPFAYLRFKFNFFKLPIGAYVFIYVLRAFNKTFKKNLTLGTQSYLDKNNLGFYNSYCG